MKVIIATIKPFKIEKFNIDGSKPEPQAAKPATPGTSAPAAPAPATPPK